MFSALPIDATIAYDDAKAEGKIPDVIIENMMSWRHSGFNVYRGRAIWPHNEEGLENLARYIIRASLQAQASQWQAGFSQERMTYIAAGESANGVAKVIYKSKDGKTSKTFDALDWPRPKDGGMQALAQLTAHIPNRGEQMIRDYGFFFNKSRGLRKKLVLDSDRGAGSDDVAPTLIESEVSSKEFRKSGALLIQKIYPAPAGLIHWCVPSAWGL